MNDNLRIVRVEGADGTRLAACSVCLRVRRGSAWVTAEEAIRQLRSFEQPGVLRLTAGLCSVCAAAIQKRRADALHVAA